MKKLFKLIGLIFVIVLLIFFYKIINIPLTQYPYYFTNLCKDTASQPSENQIKFILKNENDEPLSCKKIRIENEVWCIESPCPDFSLIRKLKTSKDGSVIIPKNLFKNTMYSYADGPPGTLIENEEKEFLFHSEGNYNFKMSFKDIIEKSLSDNIINLNLDKKSDEICSDPRWREDYCDGY